MHRAALVLVTAGTALAAYCNGSPDPNAKPNPYPIVTAAPTFLKSVPHGHSYTAGAPGFEFYLTHLYGSAYDMGYAQGQLYTPQVREMANRTWNYMVEQVAENLPSLPKWLSDLIGDVGLELALDALIDLTKPSTGAYFYEELEGLAAGAGIDAKLLERIHLIGELTQGDCSMIGAWGNATAGGKTLQLRALDWDTGALCWFALGGASPPHHTPPAPRPPPTPHTPTPPARRGALSRLPRGDRVPPHHARRASFCQRGPRCLYRRVYGPVLSADGRVRDWRVLPG